MLRSGFRHQDLSVLCQRRPKVNPLATVENGPPAGCHRSVFGRGGDSAEVVVLESVGRWRHPPGKVGVLVCGGWPVPQSPALTPQPPKGARDGCEEPTRPGAATKVRRASSGDRALMGSGEGLSSVLPSSHGDILTSGNSVLPNRAVAATHEPALPPCTRSAAAHAPVPHSQGPARQHAGRPRHRRACPARWLRTLRKASAVSVARSSRMTCCTSDVDVSDFI